jgi:hypothetical protein
MRYKSRCKQSLSLLVVMMLFLLPMIQAASISNVRAEDITENSAIVRWETDEAADGFVEYGEGEELARRGDARQVTQHEFPLTRLAPETTYKYKVESGGMVDDNGGQFYSLQTLAPDTEAPALEVKGPELVAGTKVDLEIKTEVGVQVTVKVNEVSVRSVKAEEAEFTLTAIVLEGNRKNVVTVSVEDEAGNKESVVMEIFSDSTPPVIKLDEIPKLTGNNTVRLLGSVSENSSVEIFLNNRSVKKFQGKRIDQELRLKDGPNTIKVVAQDIAGAEDVEVLQIDADTVPPRVDFEFTKGTEYYEGRAETDITGETEPGAQVFLYVFQRRTDKFKADFRKPTAVVKADVAGKFTFEEISFPPSLLSGIGDLVPRQVPSGLQEILISPLDQLAQEQRKSYDVIIIAEDATGKSGSRKKQVNVNTCFSSNLGFDLINIPQFQAPFRLDPGLMEEGRETIQSVFNLTYRGTGVATVNQRTNLAEKPYEVLGEVKFEKACTQATRDSDDYKLGCQLLPGGTLRAQPNHDKSAYYVTSNLNRAADFIEKEDNVWEDFQKRQLKMPLKITVNYRERDAQGKLGSRKTQVICRDVGYFVDVPIDVAGFLPDGITDDVISGLNDTIVFIEEWVKPAMEKAIIVTGVSCVASFGAKLVTKFYRLFQSNFEPWITRFKPDDEKCPIVLGQNELYLESTINHWSKLPADRVPSGFDAKKLEDVCPSTAGAWKVEATVDQFYRWTCDRFFCRAVPARWTEDKPDKAINNVIQEQLSCTASSTGVYLEKVENCREALEKDVSNGRLIKDINPSVCYRDDQLKLYFADEKSQGNFKDTGFWRLRPVSTFKTGNIYDRSKDLIAYQPEGSETMLVSTNTQCSNECKKRKGYNAASDGWVIKSAAGKDVTAEQGCYLEKDGELLNGAGVLLGQNVKSEEGLPNKIGSGFYTKDCFVHADKPDEGRYQCVCELDKKPKAEESKGGRLAIEPQGSTETSTEEREEWQFRQARLFATSKGVSGTKYSKDRYYSGRDLSGAFGLDWGLDNFKSKKSVAEINPNSQYIGTFQSLCVPGINARINLLQSILIGFRGCLVEAKHTGLHDAGMCKTFFTQYVCGLIYKTVAYLGGSCSPLNFKDIGEGLGNIDEDGNIGAFFGAGFNAIPGAIEGTISEVQEDYGNAKLQQFFSSGSQGFAESICLAAFGYDFPLGLDFIRDAAYAFPTHTSALMPIAERELSTFDPLKGTAVFNYNLAGVILPGCKIRGYKTSLKCIGREDLGNPNVECRDQKCDCLQVEGSQPVSAGARTFPVNGGSSYSGLQSQQLHDMPIPSPQKVASQYRYDHVLLELFLGPGEKPEQCFDQGYRTSNGGKFYFPIVDVTPDEILQCSVHVATGRFLCPEISSFFGGGQTYFEHPFMSCLDSVEEEFVDCQTPNLFLEGQEIVVRPHIQLGKDAACLKISEASGLIEDKIIPLQGLSRPYAPRIALGQVNSDMVSGSGRGSIQTIKAGSSENCGGNQGSGQLRVIKHSTTAKGVTISFDFFPQDDGTFKLKIPTNVGVQLTNGYRITAGDRTLALGTNDKLTREQIDAAVFEVDGFEFDRVLGQATVKLGETKGTCTYRTTAGRSGSTANIGNLRLQTQLFQADAGGACVKAITPVPRSSLGKAPTHNQQVRVQLKSEQDSAAANLHRDFKAGRYEDVRRKAKAVVDEKKATVEEATAIYYWIASLIMVHQKNWVQTASGEVKSLLELFFDRNFLGESVPAYANSVKQNSEYQKICTYLCEVDDDAYAGGGGAHSAQCAAGC